MQISELKETHPAIYARILECQAEQGNKPNDQLDLGYDKTQGNFDWQETSEEGKFWLKINEGKFDVFYEKYPLPKKNTIGVPPLVTPKFVPGSEISISELKAPAHYDNSKGSLYKIAQDRGWNAYVFDVVKRLDRGGKKDPLKQEIEKSIFVLQLWLKELE